MTPIFISVLDGITFKLRAKNVIKEHKFRHYAINYNVHCFKICLFVLILQYIYIYFYIIYYSKYIYDQINDLVKLFDFQNII